MIYSNNPRGDRAFEVANAASAAQDTTNAPDPSLIATLESSDPSYNTAAETNGSLVDMTPCQVMSRQELKAALTLSVAWCVLGHLSQATQPSAQCPAR